MRKLTVAISVLCLILAVIPACGQLFAEDEAVNVEAQPAVIEQVAAPAQETVAAAQEAVAAAPVVSAEQAALSEVDNLVSENKLDKAKEALAEARKKSPEDIGLARRAVEVAMSQQDNDGALKELEGFLTLKGMKEYDSNREWGTLEYYRVAKDKGQDAMAAAINTLENAKLKDPDNVGLNRSIAEGYVRLGNWAKVAEIYEGLIAKNQKDYILNTRLIDIYMILGKYDAVIQKLEPGVKQNPGDAGNSDILARAYVGAHREQEAIELYKKKLEAEPNSAGLIGRFAQALMDFGKFDEAAAQWNKAFSIDSLNLFFKQKEVEAYNSAGKSSEAQKASEELKQATAK
jgi:predicted Zn-dependent protease